MGLGCMTMSPHHYQADYNDEVSIKNIQTAYEAGVNFFDTADMYGDGHNEPLLGKALYTYLRENRDNIVIGTKCGFVQDPEGNWGVNLSPEHIKEACQASLERLGISYVDLYYLHRLPTGGIAGFQKSLDALIELLKEKKIKHVGLSEANAEAIHFAANYLKEQGFPDAFIAVQTEFSIMSQGPLQDGVLKACRELGLSFVPYSPLSRGLLTEEMHESITFDEGDFRQYLPRFQEENFRNNLKLRDALREFSIIKKCSLPQLALAWLLAQGNEIIPIPGTRHIERLKSNLEAINIDLTSEDLAEIENIVSSLKIKGTRYAANMYTLQNIKEE
jgi:aryl-alcohol dehydrogenase-like predicted oxidoreductase